MSEEPKGRLKSVMTIEDTGHRQGRKKLFLSPVGFLALHITVKK